LIDNLVQSWTFAALRQVLDETATSSLPISKPLNDASAASSGKMRPFGGHNEEQKLSLAEPKTMIHPSRTSSLSYRRSTSEDPPYAQPTASGQVVFADGQYQDRPSPGQEVGVSRLKTGAQELASSRAQLYVVQRRILEHVGKSLGWVIGWAAVLSNVQRDRDMSDVDLNGSSSDAEELDGVKDTPSVTSPTVGLSASTIVNAVSSIEQFRQSYEV
jgi:trafficking protein particle complex subunit 10